MIRTFEEDDAAEISRLIIDDLLQVNVRDYGEASVRALAASYTPALVAVYAQYGVTLVAEAEDGLLGTATLEGERVRNVFVRVGSHGRGIGKRLMDAIEDEARRQGLEQLYLLANVAAVEFYEKLGWRVVEEVVERIGEIAVKIVKMEKKW